MMGHVNYVKEIKLWEIRSHKRVFRKVVTQPI